MAEPMSDERLAEIRAELARDIEIVVSPGHHPEELWLDYEEVAELLAELDRLRAALARVTDDSMAARLARIIDSFETYSVEYEGRYSESGRIVSSAPAEAVLAAIRAAAAGEPTEEADRG